MLKMDLVKVANTPRKNKIDFRNEKIPYGTYLARKYDLKKLDEELENKRVFRDRECIAHEYCTRVGFRRKRKSDITRFFVGMIIGVIFCLILHTIQW